MLSIGFLCSGGLGFKALQRVVPKYLVKFVLTDKSSKNIIDFCINKGIPFYEGNPRNGNGFQFVKNFEVDVVCSVNYIFLIEADIIDHPKKIAFNLHGSLLPKFRGRTPHVWAIINNEKETGITAHKINTGCDTGEIIMQKTIPIAPNDTGATILDKFAKEYPKTLFKVFELIKKDKVALTEQDEGMATYFGKRKPDDGEISWDWSRERIYNWVRAQAYPYPGAFTFADSQKITIDKVKFSNAGFNYVQENGTVLKLEPLTIKTPNGALEVEQIREKMVTFKQGMVLTTKKKRNENRQ